MSGGGFCEIHGPFDPPHLVCPYCAMEDGQRHVYGPPAATVPGPSAAPPADADAASVPGDADFVRQTVEPDSDEAQDEAAPASDVTELVPRSLEADPDATRLDMQAGEDDDAQPLGYLLVKEPRDRRGVVIPVRPNQVIGREGDIEWDDPRLSRQHARFTLEPLEETVGEHISGTLAFFLWPFAPTNPVIINGQAVRGATMLNENDEIRLGDTLFVFKLLPD